MDNAIIKFIMRKLRGLYKAFSRKKVVDTVQYTPLARVLSTFDLIVLGFSSILPSNWHLAIEFLAMDRVGPAITVLFAIAAITSMFTGLCYTELGTRMPRAGSAYIYSYVSIGEFLAFLMGWILILDYAINSVATVCFLRTYIDRTFYEYHSIRDPKKKNEEFKKNFFNLSVSFKVDSLSYPDYIAFCVTLILSAMLAFGTRKTSVIYKTFTLVNLFVILIVIIVGFSKADFSNWTSNCTETNYEFGNGGFMPCSVYMVDVIYGGFRCFHVFASFDCLTISGEEAKNPRRSIPIAIIASLTITFLVYFSFIMLITVLPSDYTRKDTYNLLIFNNAKKWNCIWSTMIEIGMISGLCANLLSSIFSLSRIIYAMASDGLVFKWMGNINSRFRSPIMATVCAVLLIGILVIISSYELWIMNTIIICKLRTYWIVASCVIILRYEQSETYDREVDSNSRTFVFIVKQLINANKLNHSTKLTERIVTVFVFCYVILCICTTTLLSRYIYNMTEISDKKATFATPLVILAAVLVIILIFIYFQPVSDKELTFSVPLMPFLPGLSIFINMFFMVIKMDEFTWRLFSVWIAIGLGVYFLYGVWHSHIR